jgi:hypothetical protein
MVGILPTEWEDLPLLPLLQVCQHLDFKHVFKILPLVCRNYRNLLTGKPIFLNRLELDRNTSAKILVMLRKRVLGCKFLSIKANANPCSNFYHDLTSQLLMKLKSSVEEFHCTTTEQQPITKFMNECKRLRSVSIQLLDIIREWDWELHQTHPTIKELTLGCWVTKPNICLEGIMTSMPGLNKLVWNDDWPAVYLDLDTRKQSAQSQLIHYEGPYVIPQRFLRSVIILRLVVLEIEILEQVISLLPTLKYLQRLVIQTNAQVMSELCSDNPNNCMQRFVRVVKSCQSLRALAIGRTPRPNSAGEIFDLEMEGLLLELPNHVECIQYKTNLLRFPREKSQLLIENRDQLYAAIMSTAFP